MATPRQRIEIECARRGKRAVVDGCLALLEGRDCDDALIVVLGGPGAYWALTGGEERQYWLRVWATRGLLWAWDPAAVQALLGALRDEAWRVREMAAKVVARHRVGDAMPLVAGLREDPVERVRLAATRAVVALTAARS